MPSPRLFTIAGLLAAAVALALGNVWFTAARSTIPLALHGVVKAKEVRREKHPGHDDVFLLALDSGRSLQVDAAVYQAVTKGESLSKSPWSEQLVHGHRTLALAWSADARGMFAAMPATILVMLALAVLSRRCLR